jgi:hypothetical protein
MESQVTNQHIGAGLCKCMDPQCGFDYFDSQQIGKDHPFGTVALRTCKLCSTNWLHYQVEHEVFTGFSRWFRGIVEPGIHIQADTASALLGQMPWHFYGGSYFKTAGARGTGPVQAAH